MNIYKNRRERMINAYEGNTCIVLFSGKEIMKSEDECYEFDVNRNFYYLTGLKRSDMALVITKVDGVIKEFVFAEPYSEFVAKWYGGRMPFEEIKEVSEVDAVNEYSELKGYIAALYNRTRFAGSLNMVLDLWQYNAEQDPSLAVKFANELKAKYPGMNIVDGYPVLTSLRLIKDETEIKYISEAIATTKIAHDWMMSYIKPGMNEMMLEATFDYALKTRMCAKRAFTTIAASGKNATVLHYHDNNQVMNDGDLFLCDMGATYENYCADISRTFPVNGKFTDRQKELYEVVLTVQKMVEAAAKPGVSMAELNKLVIDFYKEELPKHGLDKDVSEYYWHSIGHQLGLDTHDVGAGRNEVLKPGMVITNEPGLYVADENIGIRIEDDLLISEDGCINLAKDLYKEVEDIEAFMANYNH